MDEVVPGYESLELDIPTPEEEMTIGEVLGTIILGISIFVPSGR
jgi:hypothetical protein